ncbi:glycoside hydrolase family 73 protein [Lapidilactobacillus gannanensis]|uniref:Glycoside hydrolase family 73 protein n=1 Tax=Lapidilactobacillus gannanensis TaxID=2486002 RepID=A0ABW4BNM0_9LACO|nr:glycoside hydrolase family 73 protein [Lapidilactobacillus gannanensis]
MKENLKRSSLIGLVGISLIGVTALTNEKTGAVRADSEEESTGSSVVLSPNSEIGPGFYSNVSQNSRFSSRMAMNTQSFIDQLAPGAIDGRTKYGVLPSVSIAQGILESGWGRSDLASVANNLFGIKGSYQGQSVIVPTQEYINGNWTTVNAQFRKYPNWSASVEDHGNFLYVNPRYSNLLGVKEYQTVTRLLQEDGYATAPTYAATLNQIIEENGLVKYDQSIVSASLGSLDKFSYSDNAITAQGWHADNASAEYPYSFLVFTDVDSGKQYRQEPINRTVRVDVAQAYPDITNTLNSGFSVSLPVSPDMYGHTFKVTSRYSKNTDGSGTNLDYNFSGSVTIPRLGSENKASLDKFTSSGSSLNMSGWHAADKAEGRPYHFLFLMDATTKTELKRINVTNLSRPDVGNAYPNIFNSGNSGFKASMSIVPEWWGKKVYVMSRYSSRSDGNADYVDYDFDKQNMIIPQPQENKAWLDNFSVSGSYVNMTGWHASDLSYGRSLHTLILMDATTGKEIERKHTITVERPDVKSVYPNLYNADKSGFKDNFVISQKLSGKKIYLISRYSNPNGNASDYVDYVFNKQVITIPKRDKNIASLDSVVQNGSNLIIKGWHASDLAVDHNYRYLFIMDKKTNVELKRVKITSVVRPDVASAYPDLFGGSTSGFNLTVSLDNLKGKSVYLMTRYATDSLGNANSVDYSYAKQGFTIK